MDNVKVGTDSLSVQDSQFPTSVSKFRQISYLIFVRANNSEIMIGALISTRPNNLALPCHLGFGNFVIYHHT